MKIYNLPQDISSDNYKKEEKIIIRAYSTSINTFKNKIILHKNMINLLISGKKTIVYPEATITINSDELLVLSTGNCLTTEVRPDNADFLGILIYFDDAVLGDFFLKYAKIIKTLNINKITRHPFVRFKQDIFIQNYIETLQLLLKKNSIFSSEHKQIKLEELLLYLLQTDPLKLYSLQRTMPQNEELQLRMVVEGNVGNPITIEELAFLCNCSVSTFKRRFYKIYVTSPQKWLLQQKLKLAASLLKLPNEKPGLVYQKLGYNNHSSFSQAFKTFFGVTPTEFQVQHLNLVP